jgi:hypothetical protein
MVRVSRKNKHKVERRRKTRRQLGGAGGGADDSSTQAIDSIISWIQAVNKSPAFISDENRDFKYKKQPEERNEALRLGTYKINELKEERLKLPPRKRDAYGFFEQEYAFELNGMGDFREEASALRDFFSNVIDQEDQLTAAEFMKHMTFLKNDPNPDIAISQQLYFAEHVECELQKLGRNIEPDPQRVLIDEQYYPLYILTLFANTDAGDGRPLLLSEEGFEKQMSEEPIPDPQVEPAI